MQHRIAFVALLGVAAACDPDRHERGCIRIDDQGRYRDVADALADAEPGATLTLCDDAIVESVVVDKAVTIEGLGSGASLWFPPEGEAAAHIEGGGDLTLVGVGIASTATTFLVDAGGALTLRDVLISQPGGWGVEATDATIVLDGSVIEGAEKGGVHATGAAATVTVGGSRLDSNLGWGVLGEAGAIIDVTDSFLRGTFVSDDNASQFDGFGVGLKSGASATITGGTADGNVLGVLYGEGGSTAVIDGLDAADNYFGVWGETLDLTIRNSTFTGSFQYDILAVAGSAVTLENVDLTADPSDADANPYQDETNTLTGKYGIVMQTGNALTIRDSAISGHNGGALFVIGAVSLDVPVVIERTVMDDNATQGALFQWADVTMTDVDVTNTRNNDPACLTEDGLINCNWAVAAFAASVDWTGGSLSNSGYIGLIAQEDSATLVGVEMANNGYTSVWADTAAVRIEGGSISGYGEQGVYAFDTVLDLVDVAFVDRDWTWALQYEDGLEYRFPDSATDVYALSSTVHVAGSSFTNGDSGFYLSGTETTVTDTTFSGYVESALTIVGGSFDGDGLSFTGMGPRSLYCFGNGVVSLSDTAITDTKNVTTTTEMWVDGVLQTPVSTNTLTGPALQTSTCAVDLAHLTIDGADDRALDLLNGDVEIADVLVRDTSRLATAGTGTAVNIRFNSRYPVVIASGLTITGVHDGSALSITGRTTDTEALVNLQDTRIGVVDGESAGVGGDGLRLVTLGCADPACAVDLAGLEIRGTGGTGLFLDGTWATIAGAGDGVEAGVIADAGADAVLARSWVLLGGSGSTDDVVRGGRLALSDTTISDPAGAGLVLDGVAYTLTDVDVSGADGEGVSIGPWIQAAGIPEDTVRVAPVGSLTNVTVAGSGASGVHLVGGEHTLASVGVASAGGWGLECALDPAEDVPVVTSCTADPLVGVSGSLQGCDACAP